MLCDNPKQQHIFIDCESRDRVLDPLQYPWPQYYGGRLVNVLSWMTKKNLLLLIDKLLPMVCLRREIAQRVTMERERYKTESLTHHHHKQKISIIGF
jgi:hypothetical protein